MKSHVKAEVVKYLVLTFAALVMALDYRTFVEWGNLYPGGAVGLAMLVQRVSQSICDSLGWNVNVPFSPINIALNAIPVWIGFKYIGKKFTLQSLYVIFMSGFLADLVPVDAIQAAIPAADLARFQNDPFLTSLFGGIVFGFGIALCLRCNATSGGTDFIAIYLSERKGRETWNLILAFNAMVLLAGGFKSGWTSALYSIIYQFVYIQVVHLMYRTYQYQTLIIITTKPKKVCEAIYRISHHGATVIEGKGAFSGDAKSVVMSVVAADDTTRIYALCKSIDANAFINTLSTSRVIGRFYLRPRD